MELFPATVLLTTLCIGRTHKTAFVQMSGGRAEGQANTPIEGTGWSEKPSRFLCSLDSHLGEGSWICSVGALVIHEHKKSTIDGASGRS